MRPLTLAYCRIALACACAAFSALPSQGGSGDIDGSGTVTSADTRLALRFAGGLQSPTTAQAAAGDTIAGAGVNIRDAVRIARIAAGLDPFVPDAGTAPLPLTEAVTVTSSATTTRNFTLSGGYRVSGRVAITNDFDYGYVSLRNTSTGETYGPVFVSGMTVKSYSFAVRPGTYQLYYARPEDDTTTEGDTLIRMTPVAVGSAFAVAGDVSGKDFAPPAPPATTGVKIAYSGTGLSSFTPNGLTFADAPPSAGYLPVGIGKFVDVDLVTVQPDTIPLAAGTYYPSLYGWQTTSLGIQVEFTYHSSTALTAPTSTTRTITVPAVRELTGMLTDPVGGGGTPADISISTQSLSGDVFSSWAETTVTSPYFLMAPAGTYYMTINVKRTLTNDIIHFTLPVTIPSSGAAKKDVSLPALPAFRTLTGVVKGPDGKALANATVSAYTDPSVTIPSGGRYTYSAYTTTDSAGKYTLSLPSDAYYVTVTPP
jgi:hypothetical protein